MNFERIKAIVTIVITAIVNIANVCGYALDADMWLNAILSVLSALAVIYCWWKNQNVTDEAIRVQSSLDHLKAERKAMTAKE